MNASFTTGIIKSHATIAGFQDFLLSEEKDGNRLVNGAADTTNGHENHCYLGDFHDAATPMTKIANGTNGVGGPINNTGGIIVSDASARWSDNNKSLDNINLTVMPGRLYAIIGPVGAGKVYNFF